MIEHIAEAGDVRIAEYAHVGDPAFLTDRGLFVAEGRLVVRRAMAEPRLRVRSVLVTPTALQALDLDRHGIAVYVTTQAILNGITGFNFHRGCLALVERPARLGTADLMNHERVLACEGVNNPDNIGGLFRVAAAFGAAVLLDGGSGDPFYRKAVRTSMGAVLGVPFARAANWPAALQNLREAGFSIVALTPSLDAQPLDTADLTRHRGAVLMVGAEGAGLSAAALTAADMRLRIPVSPAVDSLNVVVAAGIALSRLA